MKQLIEDFKQNLEEHLFYSELINEMDADTVRALYKSLMRDARAFTQELEEKVNGIA